LRLILNTDLSAKNKMHAIGSLAVPVLRYSFGIINWHQEEIQTLDTKTRKMPTIHRQHHPRTDTDRLYVPRKDGGRGLMQIEGAYTAEIIKLEECVEHTEDPLMQIFMTHQHNTNSTLCQSLTSRCRLCKEYEETTDHLTSECPTLTKNEYIIRYDKVCTHLHYSMCKKLGIAITENWYTHIPKSITEHEGITVTWNQGLPTDRGVLSNRPAIIVKNKDRTCLLTDVAVPSGM
jgi:hypothetical protein